ncbi:conserved hypothetical protein [Histoplasma capsulatum var. duboisii H88]|uniref:Uncharacterized protein n=1 Tax=Ajellomyces capsulatus (strain H88) TaxID=544711 RepID=F0U9L5_AJEC8|nr:conserved hypothetical protein [Histoplasma capsulatum var. duboisii H88]
MDPSTAQTPTSGKGIRSRVENGDTSPIAEAGKILLNVNSSQDTSRWKPLTECPDLSIPPESGIFVPDPSPTKTLHDSDGDTPKSETLGGSLTRRRRHGEYHHRPPVWNIRMLDDDVSAFSSVNVDADSDIVDSVAGLKTDNTSPHSHKQPTLGSLSLYPQADMQPNIRISEYPHPNFLANTLLEEQLDAIASTWSREPFVVATAETDAQEGNESDGGQWSTTTGSVNSAPEEPLPAHRRPSPRRRITSWPTSSSARSIDSGESHHIGVFAFPKPRSGFICDSAGPSRTSVDINETFQDENEAADQARGEEHDHFQVVKAPSLSPVIEQPMDENTPPGELAEDPGPVEHVTACLISTTTGEQPRDDKQPLHQPGQEQGHPEQIGSAPRFPEAQLGEVRYQQFGQPENERETRGNIESSSIFTAVQQSQNANTPAVGAGTDATGLDQQLQPYQQPCHEAKYLSSCKDIRSLPSNRAIGYPLLPKRKFGWAIETGSRVICVCDTVAECEYDDIFPMRLGDAYIVLQLYGDFWASCLKLTLDNQTWSAYPIHERNRDRAKSTFICPEENVKFLPLCALTLDANFGDYLARHPRNGGPCYSPATGQQVVAPKRSFSHPIGLRGSSVVVPKKILRQAKYANMPRDTSAIAIYGFTHMEVGHIRESKPSELINVDPDFTHFRPIDNIWRFKARVEKKLSRQSLREASEKIQKSSSTAFTKFVDGPLRRHFHSDPGSSGMRRFFSSHGASNTDTPAGQRESSPHQATTDTSNQTEAVGENLQQTVGEIAASSRETQAMEGNTNRPERSTADNRQPGDQITTTVNEIKS